MALPSQLNSTLPAGADLPSTIDNRIRSAVLAVEDIFGVPDQSNISVAAMTVSANGLTRSVYIDTVANASTNGHFQRNGSTMTLYDGSAARTMITDSGTQTLTNKTLTSPTINTPTIATPNIDAPTITGAISSDSLNCIQDFRLSLATATPVTVTDLTSIGTLYCTPYKGNRIALYSGSVWIVRNSAEFSLALTATSGKPYDVFCYDNAGVPTLETLVWTNDTTRATALAYQDGVLVKSGTTTRRYLGSFYTSGSNVSEDSEAKRYLYNYYHRRPRQMVKLELTDSWTYVTGTWRQANSAAGNQLDYIVGVNEDPVTALVSASFEQDTQAHGGKVGIGLGSTTVNSANWTQVSTIDTSAANLMKSVCAYYKGFPGVGRRTLVWLEAGTGAGTQLWLGDTDSGSGSGLPVQSGIVGEVWQ